MHFAWTIVKAGLTPRDWAVKKGHQSIPALLVQQVLPWQPARMDSSGIAAAPTMSVSSLESSADSGLHASASSFAAAAATATSAAARRPSLYQAPPMITDMFDDEESRDVVPVPAGAASLARPQDDSPWDKLAIFGRRSSISFKPRHVEGYLCKQGGIVRSWKVRYFVLSETKLSYFGKQVGSRCDCFRAVVTCPHCRS